jgi:hypothetical protein
MARRETCSSRPFLREFEDDLRGMRKFGNDPRQLPCFRYAVFLKLVDPIEHLVSILLVGLSVLPSLPVREEIKPEKQQGGDTEDASIDERPRYRIDDGIQSIGLSVSSWTGVPGLHVSVELGAAGLDRVLIVGRDFPSKLGVAGLLCPLGIDPVHGLAALGGIGRKIDSSLHPALRLSGGIQAL